MNHSFNSVRGNSFVVSDHVVLRNTYALLGSSLLVSALCAFLAIITRAPVPGFFVSMMSTYGAIYLINYTANSAWGILSIFYFTGFLGYSLAPVLNVLLSTKAGSAVLICSLGATAVAFLALSAYVLLSDKDFGFMQGFIFTALIGCVVASIFGLFFNLLLINVLVSCAMITISSASILYHTSEIIHGGERNYILATLSLFMAIYNLFISLIHVLSVFSKKD